MKQPGKTSNSCLNRNDRKPFQPPYLHYRRFRILSRIHRDRWDFDIDLAIFNLGAYEPRWFMASSHMNPRETVRAFKELDARKMMIVHWGTFRLGDEPVHFPPVDIKKELKKEGLLDRLVDIRHGETFFVN